MYYIQNKKAGYSGNNIYFWALESRGYTIDLNRAQKYTEEEAKKICLGNPEKNVAWPVDYIDNNKEAIQRVADSQFLEQDQIKQFN